LMMPSETAVKATRCLALSVHSNLPHSMDRADLQIACRSSLSAFGKETEEFGHKRLHGEGGMFSTCRVGSYFLTFF
jgi:hypothetical protein